MDNLRMKLATIFWRLGNWIRPPHTQGTSYPGDGSQKKLPSGEDESA